MKILVVGSGGREHAIVWKIRQSRVPHTIYCAPGNGGISEAAECVDIAADDIEGLLKFALKEEIDLTIAGPEVPLVMGITDQFQKNGLRCFGPDKKAAELEGSKTFSKYLMKKYGIPTADYMEFSNAEEAKKYLHGVKFPVVIKADGLAAGKGVIISHNISEALNAVEQIMEDKVFREAGDRIIVEEFLSGMEVSVLAFTDGKTVKPMVSSMDHKRIFDNDQGLNTGGMGTISPNPYYTDEIHKTCMDDIFYKTINAMNCEGRKFKGVLYYGVILTAAGPKVLEYNCRFGDPETQVVLPRLKSDLVDIMEAVIDERLHEVDIEWDTNAACCVIISSGGYPGKYERGRVIEGVEMLPKDLRVFHSGTKKDNEKFLTDGGRVLGITALGGSVSEAAEKVYGYIDNVSFEGMHYRKDIGKK